MQCNWTVAPYQPLFELAQEGIVVLDATTFAITASNSETFAEHILRLNQNIHAPYYALFTVGPIANAIDIWWHERQLSATTSREIVAS